MYIYIYIYTYICIRCMCGLDSHISNAPKGNGIGATGS